MWFDKASDLLPGLLPGLYGGVEFYVPDTNGTFGRRVAEYLFPGVDLPGYDDFGLYPADIEVNGILMGESYIAQAKALEAAFQRPGPATLVHPWWGPMTVMLVEPGQISLSGTEIYVARFSVTFKRIEPSGLSLGFASAGGVLSAVISVISAASAIATAASGKVISVTRAKAASRSRRIVASAVEGLGSPAGAGRFVPRLTASLPATASTPNAFDAMMVKLSGRISAVTRRPAVAPAAEAKVEEPPAPDALVAIGLELTSSIGAAIAEAPSATDRVLLIGAMAHVLAATASQALEVTYASSAEAAAYRTAAFDAAEQLVDAIEATVDAGTSDEASSSWTVSYRQSVNVYAAEMSALRRSVIALRTAIGADVNETIGRLPSIKTFSPGREIDAWQLAQHIAGDSPDQIEAVYVDIVARNRPRHPASMDGERIEVAL